MTTKFPDGFKCPPILAELYPDVERHMYPAILKQSMAVSSTLRDVDVEDAIQEGRIALLSAMVHYDYNRAYGKIGNFVGRVLSNAYHGMVYEAMAQSRIPCSVTVDSEGKLIKRCLPLLSLDDMLAWDESKYDNAWRQRYEPVSPDGWPDEYQMETESENKIGIMKSEMFGELLPRDRKVFGCKVDPSVELLKMMDNLGYELGAYKHGSRDGYVRLNIGNGVEVPNSVIAQYLGVSKNVVDWSMHKIKMLFTRLAKADDFSELYGDMIRDKGWSVIHDSNAPRHDKEFVRQVIRDRRLDPNPLSGYTDRLDYFQKSGKYSRMIERYPWGVVLVLGNGLERRTLVIEGRFNVLTGEVFGANGAREKIPVAWYGEMVRKFKESNQ